jgi:NAD(P)-dependent dehydrogenase (short-subunit alcohol dehydrogenase family)
MTDTATAPSAPSVVVISGTSTGIGLTTAVATARAGWTTVATMRNLSGDQRLRDAATAAGVALDIRRLDITDPVSIAECIDSVIADYGRLDALVNNAGAAHVATIENESIDDVRECLEVNFFGVVQLTRAALPHLRASGGRVVTISSVGGVVGQPFNEAYCAAKFAVEGFMESLAPVALTVGVHVSLVEPGAVASEFVNNAGLDPATMLAAAGPYAPALAAYLKRTTQQFSTAAQAAAAVGDVVLRVLIDPAPPLRVQTSDAARAFAGSKLTDLDGAAVLGITRTWVGLT